MSIDISARSNRAHATAFNDKLGRLGAVGRWNSVNEDMPWSPRPESLPTLWRHEDIRPLAVQSADFVKGHDAALRVITLVNPGHRGSYESAVGHLYSGLQVINPDERMTAHRHAASAIRYVIEGSGGWTAVDGDKIAVEPGDVVVTPSQLWHEHGNDTDTGPVIWQDCTNDPLVNTLGANFFELHPEGSHLPGAAPSDTLRIYGGVLLPDDRRTSENSTLFSYPWRKCYDAVRDAAESGVHSAFDGTMMEFTNPVNGNSVTQTMGAHLQRLMPGETTLSHRHTGSVVYVVAQGSGHSVIDGEPYEWAAGDTFCVPSWSTHRHTNRSIDDEAVLFSYNEFPLMRRLGLYVEEPVPSMAP